VEQTEISGRCYGLMCKNGEWIVVDFTCVKSRHVGILHNLTDMRWKPSASFGLCVDRVLVVYRIGILHNLTDMRRKPSAGFGLRVDRVLVAYQRSTVRATLLT
jgi:hypothetical protein